MGWRRVGTQPPHTSSHPVSLCSSLPLFLLPARHYKNVLSAPDAYSPAELTASPPPPKKKKEKKRKNGPKRMVLAAEQGGRGKRERERDKEVIG